MNMKNIPTAVIATLLILALFFTAGVVGNYFCPTPTQTCRQAPLAPIDDDDTTCDPMIGFKIIQFTASWCGPCKTMEPSIQRLANEDYPILKCDVDRDPNLPARFKVKNLPTIIYLKDGKELHRYVGVQTFDTLSKKFHELVAKFPPEPNPEPKPKPVKPQDNDDSGLPVDKGRYPYIFQMPRPRGS